MEAAVEPAVTVAEVVQEEVAVEDSANGVEAEEDLEVEAAEALMVEAVEALVWVAEEGEEPQEVALDMEGEEVLVPRIH